jgi:hypothetical protein
MPRQERTWQKPAIPSIPPSIKARVLEAESATSTNSAYQWGNKGAWICLPNFHTLNYRPNYGPGLLDCTNGQTTCNQFWCLIQVLFQKGFFFPGVEQVDILLMVPLLVLWVPLVMWGSMRRKTVVMCIKGVEHWLLCGIDNPQEPITIWQNPISPDCNPHVL